MLQYRAISLAEMMDTPILLVHISSETSTQTIRDAQTRLLPIYAETCPQYLWLLSERLKGDDYEGETCSFIPVTRVQRCTRSQGSVLATAPGFA
jgi:dihydropyrimidinase